MYVERKYQGTLKEYLSYFPAVGIVGSRQVGKTTLVKKFLNLKNVLYLDLESLRDLNKLRDAETFLLENRDKLVIIDEIQRKPELFPLLRSVIDRDNRPGRFIILGSASPELIRDSSESLAGRIIYIVVHPFDVLEVDDINHLWLRGGYPKSYLAPNSKLSTLWRTGFIQTYIEKDLPLLGLNVSPLITNKLWSMMAHLNGQMLNYSLLSKSTELSSVTIKSYIDFFEQAYLIRRLGPYTANLSKRLVKSPKIYFIDTGLLHNFLNISTTENLLGHPKCGDSWEAFCIQQIITAIADSNYEVCFFRTQDGAECDVVILSAGKPLISAEIKLTNAPSLSKGNMLAMQHLQTQHNFVITPSSDDYPYNKNIRVCSIQNFVSNHLQQIVSD